MRSTLLMVLAAGLAVVGLGSGGPVVQSVTGNGHTYGEPRDRTTTFEILKYADGSVSGWYHTEARGRGGASVQVRIECLHVVGNQAWATGVVAAAANPDNIGRPYSVRFVDNGEGAGAVPDEIGTARFEEYDCTTEPDIPLHPLETGNLHVRG